MNIGKLPNNLLEKLILNTLETRRSETVVKPAVGEDCCVLDLGGKLCVISTDPITAADENAGILAVLVSLNDLAASGAEPVGILTTVLFPPGTNEAQIFDLFKSINETCARMNIDVLGGHTEITDTVNKPVIITTAIGKVGEAGLIKSSGAREGDSILITKAIGLEGTSIIASDKKQEISKILSADEILTARSFIKEISVLEEGLFAARNGASSMHDITEGGVLGAVWEVCRASCKGAEIKLDDIPVRNETSKICSYYKIDPYRLISSGSMLITCASDDRDRITDGIKDMGITCTEIGIITPGDEIYYYQDGAKHLLGQPESDELYKVI
ncbi:MAG: AIR synthase family protein [Clostridia bacterium]